MRKIVAGNWKMNNDRTAAIDLIEKIISNLNGSDTDVEVVIAPPFPFLQAAIERGRGSRVTIAAQNCHQEEKGAFTGEVSVGMLESLGVGACIVGHSERRQYFCETDDIVHQKIEQLLKYGMTPIYCCGEVQEERETGKHFEVVERQIREALSGFDPNMIARLVIAYEPVWAIGTGLTATPDQAQEMHAFIRQQLRSMVNEVADAVPILYGGSCKPDNAQSLFSQKDVNGGLIGGASLDADQFTQLIQIAAKV